MDLFVVKRFEGDDSDSQPDASASKSSHLERLLSKIKDKKCEAESLARTQDKQKRGTKKRSFIDPTTDTKSVDRRKVSSTKGVKRSKQSKRISSDIDGKFTVIGSDSLAVKKKKVNARLPFWLANPSVVSVDLQNLTVSINDIPQLHSDLVDKLCQSGISHFFPVQHQVIPWLLEAHSKPPQFWPRDICVSAPTGSGKTLSFVLPIIQALRCRLIPRVRALVVLPVQELATQVYKVFLDFIGVTNLNAACINGKESFHHEQSQLVRFSEADAKFHSCVDIVVTTPGRLVDHLQSTEGFTLQYLKFLVIDEADRVMETMQNDWLYHLDKHVNPDNTSRVPPLTIQDVSVRQPPPQKLLFSATLSEDPEKLQQLGLFQPRLFTSIVSGADPEGESTSKFVGKFTTPAELDEYWVKCNLSMKPLLLYHLIQEGNWNTILVFTNSVEAVHRLAVLMKILLKDAKSVSEVSSALSSKQRKQIFERFASGAINVLISSDALARGIDVPNIDCVISYDVPKYIKNYIHRVGRAGRAGRQGTAFTLVEDQQKTKFDIMLNQAGKKVKEKIVQESQLEAQEDDFKNALAALKLDIQQEQNARNQIRLKPKKKAKKYLNFKIRKLQGVTKSSSDVKKAKNMRQKVKQMSRKQ